MNQIKHKSEASHLLCREIQAPLVACLIKGYSEKIGEEQAFTIAREVIGKDAANSGRNLAEKFGGNSLLELCEIVKEVWAEDGTLNIENLELGESSLRFDVTSCGYAEMYERLGIKEMGYLLSCCRDFAFMDGFNPEIELVRTKTIMEGESVCNFCYEKK